MSTLSDELGLNLSITDADLEISAEEEERRHERQKEQKQEVFRQNRLARLQGDQSREEEVQKIQEVRQTSPGVPTPPTPELRPPNPHWGKSLQRAVLLNLWSVMRISTGKV